jgi:hypothetical protein
MTMNSTWTKKMALCFRMPTKHNTIRPPYDPGRSPHRPNREPTTFSTFLWSASNAGISTAGFSYHIANEIGHDNPIVNGANTSPFTTVFASCPRIFRTSHNAEGISIILGAPGSSKNAP